MVHSPEASAGRHSILELAPLELDCMNALWRMGEATVRQIQDALKHTRPRAYTTIMTILDRLAQKGTVLRHKAGRAWVYRANLSAQDARSRAVAQVVEGFFDGSPEALASHLSSHTPAARTLASHTLAADSVAARAPAPQSESERNGQSGVMSVSEAQPQESEDSNDDSSPGI